MNVVMFEISTANPKEYTLLFYSNNLFIIIRKYLASLEKLFKKYYYGRILEKFHYLSSLVIFYTVFQVYALSC